ncbi:DinB family protein [Flavobacterium azooxidireducens]|uniref:DinB family protein n=1 Tax=Flavobacterium azooxidireducens TaxID=1871076 RepID=A0ABY4KG00_9FLAO|nr:DinB family protein [Flavobacterium azooxidireducens]UPQ79484.1 DinB family protein [Flavobacterium azooxidireducens]
MNSYTLQPTEYAPYYSPYIIALGNVNLIEELEKSMQNFEEFLTQIPSEKHEFRYAEGKWTIKDIVQHLIDAERIFAYRSLRFARKDQTPLSGFDENEYVDATDANKRTLSDLLQEYKVVRLSTMYLFKSFTDEELMHMGIALNNSFTVRAIGFIALGHQKHHQHIIEERYL